jgi:hypothetical protein
MKTNLADQMLHLMSDGGWHSTEELVEKVSHRFSATMHTLRKKGYKFQKRHLEGGQYEYRLVIPSQVSA